MTTPATTDTKATVAQIARLVEAGCEIVRLTVPTSADAGNLPNIRRELAGHGIRVPLVADIHFTPAVALKAVEHVEKIRINPGNFADRKRFAVREYSEAEYAAELERIEMALAPLLRRCMELGVSMRIGTNHGSLSDRILNRYGDTPEGMVESALEFVRICESHGYRDLVLSMKASNPVVVLETHRHLLQRMTREGMDYPLHLGVTEAGEGEDARIKSAIGIGALLEEGIGDTVRVSLTEDPVAEIPVARSLVAPFNARLESARPGEVGAYELVEAHPGARRRLTETRRLGPRTIGGNHPVMVEVPLCTPVSDADGIRGEIEAQAGARVPQDTRAEMVSVRVADQADVEALGLLRRWMELVAPGVAVSARIDAGIPFAVVEGWADRLQAVAHRVHGAVNSPWNRDAASAVGALLERASDGGSGLLIEMTWPEM
jgi:(E)-4-hydroxy-3-methylbut-2-enyl-diphosphate synthase